MTTTTAPTTGLLASLFLAVPIGDVPVFAPEEGATVTRTFREKTEMEIESAVQVFNGEEMSEDGLEVEVRNEREFSFTDEYVAVGEDRVDKLARTYGTVSSMTFVSSTEPDGSTEEGEVEGESELEGAEVVFAWDEDNEEYDASFAEDSDATGADLLDGLTPMVDLSMLLPPAETEDGESWDLEPEALAPLLRYGGDLSLIPDIDVEDSGQNPVIMCFFLCLAEVGEDVEGEVELTWNGMEETDDGEFASISITLDLTSTRDGAEAITEIAEALDMDSNPFEDMGTVEFEYAFDGEGTLLWDVENNVAHGLELTGNIETVFAVDADMGGMTMSMRMTFAGTTELSVDVE